MKVSGQIITQLVVRDVTDAHPISHVLLQRVLLLHLKLVAFRTGFEGQRLLLTALNDILSQHRVEHRAVILEPALPHPRQIVRSIVRNQDCGFVKEHLHSLEVVVLIGTISVIERKCQALTLIRQQPHHD